MIINNEIFESFLNCKYKAYLKLSGSSGNITEYEIMQHKIKALYKRGALKNVLSVYKEKEILDNPDSISAFEGGKKVIINAHINYDGLELYCDFMEKNSGKSDSGSFHYVPFVFIAKEKVSKEDKLMLAYNGLVIGYMQNRQPKYGEVIYGKLFKRTKINLDGKLNMVMKLIDDLKESCGNVKPPQLILNRHCQICEFKDLCKAKVVEKDDLSLLYGISAKEIETQNKKGIFSITQYSYTFRPRRKFRKSYPFNLKALAIREKKIYVYGKPEIPTAKVQVYLDVEGDPDSDFYYLIGVIVVQEESEKHYAFWAEDQSQEKAIFSQFLNIIKNYPEFKLYHYGSYEKKFLQKMQKGIGQENIQVFNKLVENSMNVLSIIYSHVFFPTYSNRLKDIGTYLGFKWSSEDASGISSLVWRKRWEINKKEDLKEKLFNYNLEDCLALKYIAGLIYRISNRDTLQENEKEHFNLVYTDDLKTDPNHKFKKVDYCFSDLEYINQCAYFDYQREKVFIHTNKNIRKANRYYKKLSERSYRIDKHIYLNARDKCPLCGNKKPYRHHNCTKKVLDLKFSNYGAKRYITVYHTTRLRCIKCKNFFTPNYFRRIEKYGHGLISLIAYHHIAISQTFGRINEILTDLYGISLGRESLHRFKSLAAEYYQETYKKIINKLIKGTIIHVDETMVKIERERRYVWVFTNMEEVVFTYTKTREGYFLKEFLAGFKGVLISDFYAAYDSLDCPQQKCLIHLIRDLNEDVLRNPFDEEYKEMVQHFSILLREIIATVDKHGLKSRILKKYKKGIDKYFGIIANRDYKSEVAQKCQKRLLKNKDRLFTFLDFDGVPWNNNNAEHSIKHFAKYRHITDGCFTEQGIGQYLLLLSIYQTCRYKGINFLKFLVSKEKDIDKYPNGHRRKAIENDEKNRINSKRYVEIL